jgi:hypothetical protein
METGMTMDRYSHVLPSMQQNAMRQFDDLMLKNERFEKKVEWTVCYISQE